MTIDLRNIASAISTQSYEASTVTARSLGAPPITKSFHEFADDVRSLRNALDVAGIRAGHVIGIKTSSSYEFLVWDIALLDIGVVAHVFTEEAQHAHLREVSAANRCACVVDEQVLALTSTMQREPQLAKRYLTVHSGAPRSTDEDLLTRVYSSGTTGRLRGLEISRRGAESLAAEFIETFDISKSDRHLIFLPLSHFQQRLSVYTCLWAGASIMITPHTHVFHDLQDFGPTFLIGPPALYEALLNAFTAGVSKSEMRKEILAGLGGRIRFMITGMAPVRRTVLDAFAEYEIKLLEAYGITEIGLVSWNLPALNRLGTVGLPLKQNRIKVAEDSEILVRSESPLTKRYFDASEEESRQTFREDGYIATGDIGGFDDGYLVLNGRKKDIIVTSGGLKFHPLELERMLLTCPAVKQVAIVSESRHRDVVAIISMRDSSNSAVTDAVKRRVAEINQAVDAYKRIARVIFTTTYFSIENGLLTRTLKPNRAAITQRFCYPESAPSPVGVASSL